MKAWKAAFFAITLAMFVLSTFSAQAVTVLGTISAVEDGLGAVGKVGFWASTDDIYDPADMYSYEVRQSNVYSGIYLFTKTGGTGEANLIPDSFGGVCVDVGQLRKNGTFNILMPEDAPDQNSYPGGPIGVARADLLRELWGRHFDNTWLDPLSMQSTANKQAAEAFGMAIWEIVNERSGILDVGAGSFMVAPDGQGSQIDLGVDYVNGLLASLDGTGPMANLRVITNSCSQDFLVVVPEPNMAILVSSGIAGFLFLLRRRSR